MTWPSLIASVCAEIGLSQRALATLISEDATFREVWEDLLLVSEALEHWTRRNGPDSRKALQYRELRQDRVDEIRTRLQRRGIPGNAA